MKKLYVMAAFMLGAGFTQAQDTLTIDFESFVLPSDSVVIADTNFVANSENDQFESFAANFGATKTESMWGTFYNGFTYSNFKDTVTAGYTNPYSAYAGTGSGGSSQYAIYFPTDTLTFDTPQTLVSVDITNNTYAGLSMKNGDAFAKQFGSVNGADGNPDGTNGEDFFSVKFIGHDALGVVTDSVEIFLADYRFADNTQDYILKDWMNFNLSALGAVSSVTFKFTSSDVGAFGINTPKYFAMDNLIYNDAVAGADVTINFDDLYLNKEWTNADTHFIASSADDAFSEGTISFGSKENISTWGNYYTGFTYSNRTDATTTGYTNAYSSNTGTGANGSAQYAIYNPTDTITFDGPAQVVSADFTNNTYATFSMLEGDAFAKQFGSVNGADGNPDGTNGEDFFFVTFYGWDVDGTVTDSVDVYLADYRFSDDMQDYILTDWTNFDLSDLGIVKTITMKFTSSDVGSFGMNTPAYFAMDNFKYYNYNAGVEENTIVLNNYPNPTSSILNVNGEAGELMITSLNGQVVYASTFNGVEKVDVSTFTKGLYLVTLVTENGTATQKVVVQ